MWIRRAGRLVVSKYPQIDGRLVLVVQTQETMEWWEWWAGAKATIKTPALGTSEDT